MSMSLFNQLQNHFPNCEWKAEVPLASYTYMKIGGPAEVLWEAKDIAQLREVLQFALSENISVTILGGASNVVVRDGGIRGLVIINRCERFQVIDSPTQLEVETALDALPATVFQHLEYQKLALVETGIRTALLVRQTIDAGLTGLEPFLGVPGTLGGAIFNNAHYTEELIGTFVVAVEVVSPAGESFWLSQEQCDFAYDHSRFHTSGEKILRVLFGLDPGTPAESLQKVATATQKRATTQPLGTANSGCMFQNALLTPQQRERFGGKAMVSAGWLIDQAGLKGERVGQAIVSSKHANFIINEGGASAKDVAALVEKVQAAVKKTFGIELKTEVFFIGEEE